jgi:predicted nuclease of predicted toxin-antitoxin system
MRVIVDEDLPKAVADLLTSRGYDAQHVLHLGLGGKPDSAIFRSAQERQALLLTADLDFGNVLTCRA